jgi:hypothetical protein
MVDWSGWLTLLHLASTLFMVGVIWFVQLVHYPLMAHYERSDFVDSHLRHTRRTGRVVIGPMLVEAATAFLLVWPGTVDVAAPLAWAGLVVLAVVWASTFGLQVPQHRRLARGFDPAAHRVLVRSNWLRTAAWTVRGALAVAMLV